ncbi:transport and Golgi organization protein 6 homolog [Lingula anatina]|uniref:Transport and Golgi organization protein 6 homolog n=1 Tax=Lingula anatina TaxID=7574 RepID=A0A1S3K1B0_LINAN|nr:transport and Golgi organization protein 6 homolog [Lingula anatina]|eukprot:XP_013416415.1 transport and Golgi organization protein 6 homolog [Lingula anatina]
MLLPSEVVEVINILVSPVKDEIGSDAPSFNRALEKNLTALEEKLSSQTEYQQLCEEILAVCGSGSQSVTSFLSTAVILLKELHGSLQNVSPSSENAIASQQTQSHPVLSSSQQLQSQPAKPVQKPQPAGEDVLSVSQDKTIQSLLQFIIGLGICPNLLPGVGVSFEQRSGYSDIVKLSSSGASMSVRDKQRFLFHSVKVLVESAKHPVLGTLILSRHLGDILAALLQMTADKRGAEEGSGQNVCKVVTPGGKPAAVTSCGQISTATPAEPNISEEQKEPLLGLEALGSAEKNLHINSSFDLESARQVCESHLQDLLTHIYEPLLVRELLVLQGSMPSKEHSKGAGPVQVKSPVWLRKKCSRLLSEIMTRPRGVQAIIRGILSETAGGDDWQKCAVVGQIIAKPPSQVTSAEEYYKMVAPQILELLHFRDPQVQRQFLRVACCTLSAMMLQQPELAQRYLVQPVLNPLLLCTQELNPSEGQVVVCEEKLTECLDDICKILVVGGDPQCGLSEVVLEQVLVPLFELHCYCLQGISHVRAAVKAPLLHYMKSVDQSTAVRVLHMYSCGKNKQVSADMNCHLEFSAGPNGGVMVVGTVREEEKDEWEQMNKRIAGVMDILTDLQQEGLVAAFFIYLLQELTSIISKKMEPDQSPVKPGQELLRLEQTRDKQTAELLYNLTVLQLVAALSESLGQDSLKTPRHMLEFVKVSLEREAKRLELEDEDEEELEVFGKETLSMAVAMLTMMLGGDQLSSADKDFMMEFLPLLDNIGRRHPDPFIQSLAGDLRVTIATRGKVWLGENSKSFQQVTERMDHGKCTDASGTSAVKVEERGRKEDSKKMMPGPKLAGGRKLVEEITQKKTDTKDKIKNRNHSKNSSTDLNSKSSDKMTASSSTSDVFDTAFQELFDHFIPTRGHAQIVLSRLLKERHPKAMEKWETLAKVFQENLDHEDSYIYLSAIQGLACLADTHPGHLVPVLAAKYGNFDDGQMEKGRHPKARSPELRMKLGEVLMKSTRCLGDLVPKFRNPLLTAFLSGAKDGDFLIRASSLSNLGEVCKLLRFSLGPVTQEVLACCSSLAKTDNHVEVRRAAVQLITLLLQGLGEDALKVLESELRDIYRLLKHVMTVETDDVIKLHAQMASEELETTMKSFLFPEQTFTKKISVLDPP